MNAINHRIYCFGGGPAASDVFEYDAATDTLRETCAKASANQPPCIAIPGTDKLQCYGWGEMIENQP
jgi:hypothetical protein